MKRLLIALLLAVSWPAFAQTRISAMPSASALSGSEGIYCVQSSADRKCTPAQLNTYISATTKTLTNKTISGASNTITGIPPAAVTGTAAILGANTFTGAQGISDTTDSTSTTTGALTVAGGVGVAKKANFGDAVTLDSTITTRQNGYFGVGDGSSTGVGLLSGGYVVPISPVANDNLIIRGKGTGAVLVGYGDGTGGLNVYSGPLIVNASDATINGLTVGRGPGNDIDSLALGLVALQSNSSGVANTAVGRAAMYANTTGLGNTAVGYGAGYGPAGVNANATGNSNTYIGYATVGSANNNTNETVIGANAVGNGSNTVTIGDGGVTATYLKGTAIVMGATASPASNAACTAGSFMWDASYIYICTASGAVKRAALTGGY